MRILPLFFMLCGSVVCAQQSDDSSVTLVAQNRQERLETIEFQLHITETAEPRFSTFARDAKDEKEVSKGDAPHVHQGNNKIVFDGPCIRYEDSLSIYNATEGRWKDKLRVIVSDGSIIKYISGPPVGMDRKNTIAKISTTKTDSVADAAYLTPLHLTCRGYSNPSCRAAGLISQFQPTGATLKMFDTATVEYVRDPSNSIAGRIRLWLDPGQDYSIRRIRRESVSGTLTSQTDVKNRRHASGVWLPTEWVHTSYSAPGKIQLSQVVTVTDVAIGQPSSSSSFDLDFPPNVQVYDSRSGKYHIVRKDGSQQPLSHPGEQSSELQASLESNWIQRNWLWLSLLLASVSVAGAIFFRVMKKNRL